MKTVWGAFWRELNTPDSFGDQPYIGCLNQVGHIAVAAGLTMATAALWYTWIGPVPNLWVLAALITLFYGVGIELLLQKWRGADTVLDTAFVGLGASLVPLSMSLTPSGRWFRVGDWSTGFLIWFACAALALAAYVYPRLVRAYGGSDDKSE